MSKTMKGLGMKEDNNRLTLSDCSASKPKMLSFLKEKGENHRQYKRYAGRDRQIDNLIKCQLILSDGEGWNDTVDAINLQNQHPGKRYYSTCFSVSTKENVAMWMIYADFSEPGMMVSFSRNQMKQILAPYKKGNKQIELGYFESGRFVVTNTVTVGPDDIYLADIVYSSDAKDPNTTRFTHSDQHAAGKTSVKKKIPYLFKEYSWFYERECRLIVAVDDSLVGPSDKYVRLTYPEEINEQLKESGSIVESPNYGYSEYSPSELKGKVNFSESLKSRKVGSKDEISN